MIHSFRHAFSSYLVISFIELTASELTGHDRGSYRVNTDLLQKIGLGRKEGNYSIVTFTEQPYVNGVGMGSEALRRPTPMANNRYTLLENGGLPSREPLRMSGNALRLHFTGWPTVDIVEGMPT